MRAAIGGFHDAGAAAGGDHEAMARAGQVLGPGGDHAREDAGVLVEARHLDGSLGERKLEVGGLAGELFVGRGGLLLRGRKFGGIGILE